VGFWHTGYMEFHEPTGEGSSPFAAPKPVTFPCATCGVEFSTARDLRVHTFEGHPVRRPVLVFNGRECGRSRLIITSETMPKDWVIRTADAVSINGKTFSVGDAGEFLSSQRSGVVDVTLSNLDVVKTFQFEFALADMEDLDGVDAALARLVDGAELSRRSIDDFIMRCKQYPTAVRYQSGLADYLYGVLAREDALGADISEPSGASSDYEGKYDRAVGILRSFDRPPAEAICGIVAFHYNQFERAMTKTKSQRVAEVSLRFQALLKGQSWSADALSQSPHPSLDVALSDSIIEQVLRWTALPLDGTAAADMDELAANIRSQRPYDALKLHLVAAEHALAVGDISAASRHAESLRHSRLCEKWYADFRLRTKRQGVLEK